MHSMHTNKASIVLSDKLWERILRFMPGDNLYRALWSRYHNASQEFYDEIVYAYVQSHFVPEDLVQAILDKHFLFFKGLSQEQASFREKIISAFAKYISTDTQKYKQYVANVTSSSAPWDIPVPLSDKCVKRIITLLYSRAVERILLRKKLEQTGKYTYVIKDIKKILSCITCYKQFFTPVKTKLAFVRALNKTKNWLNEHGIKLQAVFMLCTVHALSMLVFVDKQEYVIASAQACIALLLFVTLVQHGTIYVDEEIVHYVYDQYIMRIDYLENIQQKIAVLLRELE